MKLRKKSLSSEIIHDILKKLSPSLSQACNALIPTLAYALLLRHDETSHLNCSNFSAEVDGLKILITLSKTDTYREGKYVFLSKENRSLYDLKISNLKIGQNHSLFGPFGFDHSVGNKKLFYNVFNKIVKDAVSDLGLNSAEFGTHSARSAGATALRPL